MDTIYQQANCKNQDDDSQPLRCRSVIGANSSYGSLASIDIIKDPKVLQHFLSRAAAWINMPHFASAAAMIEWHF